ncbi:MAG: S8 family serine peptidase [Candidatus Saliniplasma sp.]
MQIDKRFAAFIVAIVMLVSVLSAGIVMSAREAESEVMLVRMDNKSDLDVETIESEIGQSVLEEYDDFALVKTSEENKDKLERDGFTIESLENRDYVGLQSYSFNVEDGEPDIPEELELGANPYDGRGYYILQFIGPIKNEWKEKLEDEGVVFHEFRHRFNFIVEMDSDTKERVESHDFVEWTGIYQPAYRFDRSLLDGSGDQLLELRLFDGADSRETVKEVDDLGGDIKAVGRNSITAEVYTERIEKIAAIDGLNSISEGMEEPELANADATWVTQTNEQDNRKVTEQGVTGTGQLLTVCDSELYTTDDGHEMWEDPDGNDFGDNHRKVQDYYSIGGDLNDGQYHGTHVTGTVLGDAPTYDSYDGDDGNAMGARLIHQDIGTSSGGLSVPNDMYADAWQPSYDSGSTLHTNSWGGGISSYTGLAIDGDQFIWDNEDYNILFAMGNEGDGAETMSGEPEGKNFFSVGGVTNSPDQNTMASFSSRGYADDGRIKPTVIHVAENVVSSERSYDGYQSMSGTSMATPGLAGQVGQVRQYYEDGFHVDGTSNENEGFNPSNALVRSTIINGAVEITGDGAYTNDARFPNNDQGYGRSKLDRALHFDGDDRNLIAYDSWNEDNELDTGESWTTEFVVDDPTQELEATLAWSDYPGSDGSDSTDPAIVNDLDLELTGPNGDRYVGNAFTGNDPGYSEANPTSNPWNGQRDAEYDGLNVEEDILLLPDQNGVEEGTYELTVSGNNVPESTQPFAVAVSGGVTEVGSDGIISLDKDKYTIEDNVGFTVKDSDLEGTGSVDVTVDSDTETSGETVTLTETSTDGVFEGSIDISSTDSTGVLQVSDGDTITGYYEDEDTGDGSSATKTDTAIVDGSVANPSDLTVEWSGLSNQTVLDDDVEGGDLGYTTGGTEDWAIRTHGANSGSNSWDFGDGDYTDPSTGGMSYLTAPTVDLSDAEDATLSFYHWRDFESDDTLWDGGNVKISTDDGSSWSVITPEGGYDGTAQSGYDNPLAGESVYGYSSAWEQVTFDLSSYVGNASVNIRWEAGVDSFETTDAGWRIDDINITKVVPGGTEDNLVNWTLSPDDGAGEDDVTQYNIYRSDSEAGPWDETNYLTSVSAGTDSYRDVDKGELDGTTWWYVVRAEDEIGNEDSNTDAVPEPGAGTSLFDISLTTDTQSDDWNFVSFNLVPDDTSLTAILEDADYGIDGNYDKVMYYDASTDEWLSYIPGRDNFNDDIQWDETKGLWIQMTTDDTLTVEGSEPTSTDITLNPGWNMVSYPSSTAAVEGTPAEVSIVGHFDAAQDNNLAYDYDPANFEFNPGEGYYLYNDADYDVNWSVEY